MNNNAPIRVAIYAGSILQIEPEGLNYTIRFEQAQVVENTKCFGSIEDD